MALVEIDPKIGFEAGHEFSEHFYEDLELMRAREITDRTYSAETMERILPFFSPADKFVEAALSVHDKDHSPKPYVGHTFMTGWMSLLNKTTEYR